MALQSNLLSPKESFDWAEDVENSAQGREQKNLFPHADFIGDKEISQWDRGSRTHPEPASSYAGPSTRRGDHQHQQYICWDGNPESLHNIPNSRESEIENSTFSTIPSPNIDSSSQKTKFLDNETVTNRGTQDSTLSMFWTAHHEFAYRQGITNEDLNFHHFNWQCRPVYYENATTASESLAVIFAGAKPPYPKGNMRIQSIMNRANQLIDPVVVDLKEMQEGLLNERGSKLQHAAKSCTFKFYTPHGKWMYETTHAIDKIALDDGKIETYTSPHLAIGNGFIKSSLIPTHTTWQGAPGPAITPPKRPKWQPEPSPLRRLMTMNEFITEGMSYKQVSWTQSGKNAEVVPVTETFLMDTSMDPDTYYSFPAFGSLS
ncbi:hypothetical protein N7462_004772 [Penicillium macrosclerotiorum]|uniref:uncharacterized protein n=1 Tax=Penicillium macrosclerotiorum TaxID=303699 RepID=UPI002548A9A2|nr:uncharacterized protein N7462_004772 [Penicillium macrosclerotiorum]KAJ5690380.1 hypothetical protein N7462_004772 [Penicillium macrosclerotiorum]